MKMQIMKENRILFTDASVIAPEGVLTRGWLLTKGRTIAEHGEGAPPQGIRTIANQEFHLEGHYLLPGFIDLHTHGAAGVDLMTANVEDFQLASNFYASHGVTGFLATTWSASADVIRQTLQTAQEVMGREDGAALLGIHLEGPFINPVRAGAQSPQHIRPARPEEVLPYLDSGLVKLVSLAPEIEQNQWLIQACMERGIVVSAGHSDATYADMRKAVSAGVRHITHCFNGMRAFNQREPGVVGAALELDDFSCEVIADKVHVHPAALRLLLRLKPRDKVVLVTDSIAGTGMPEGIINIQGRKFRFTENEVRLLDGTLAGSVLTMDAALRNLIEISAKPLEETFACASTNPARVIGIDGQTGSINTGLDADLVLLNDDLQVQMTVVRGEIVYERGSESRKNSNINL